MNLEVLVATMNQSDFSLIDKMNIKTDALVGNQCDKNSIESFTKNNNIITYFNFSERGVGLNRNNTLMRAKKDYIIFSDDDVVYYDDYASKIIEYFEKLPKADVLVFNIDNEPESEKRGIKKVFKIGKYNYMRYGAVRIAAKTKIIHEKGIFFNLCYGGGTEHSSGEDTIFLHSCLKMGLRIYAVPISIGKLENNRPSTWFHGYDDKFFHDKGCLFKLLYPKTWKFYCLQNAIRHRKKYNISFLKSYSKMVK